MSRVTDNTSDDVRDDGQANRTSIVAHQNTGYSQRAPNVLMRERTLQIAQQETENYERYKMMKTPDHFNYRGSTGGTVPEEAARKKAMREHLRAKQLRLEKQNKCREEKKRVEEAKYNNKKEAARKQAELNKLRNTMDNERRKKILDDDMQRKNNAFLDHLQRRL